MASHRNTKCVYFTSVTWYRLVHTLTSLNFAFICVGTQMCLFFNIRHPLCLFSHIPILDILLRHPEGCSATLQAWATLALFWWLCIPGFLNMPIWWHNSPQLTYFLSFRFRCSKMSDMSFRSTMQIMTDSHTNNSYQCWKCVPWLHLPWTF